MSKAVPMATTTKLVTYEEMLAMPENHDVIEEVIDGEIYTMPPNRLPHTDSIENLADLFRARLDRKRVRIYTANFGLVIRKSPLTCRVPALAVFVRNTMIVRDGYIHSAPELLVEVLSPGNTRRDQKRLMQDYEGIGAPEVWLLSNETKTIVVLQLVDGGLVEIGTRDRGQIAPRLFPEAIIDIEVIWP